MKFAYEYQINVWHNSYSYVKTDETPDFILKNIGTFGSYCIMDNYSEGNDSIVMAFNHVIFSESVLGFSGVRPVINLKKCALDNSCKSGSGQIKYITKTIKTYKSYHLGNEIEYKGNSYYVVKQYSKNQTNYLMLIRKEHLSENEIRDYYNSEYNQFEVPFYKSDNCENESNSSDCTNKYDKSIVKEILNNWIKENANEADLVEVNGYNTRIVSINDLRELFAYHYVSSTPYVGWRASSTLTPEWVKSDSDMCWIMDYTDDSNTEIYVNGVAGPTKDYVYNNRCIRPIIYLNTCALEDGCYEENLKIKVCVEDEVNNIEIKNKENSKKDETKSALVYGDNTLKSFSYFLLIISVVLIIGGIVILRKIYSKRN